MRFLIGIVTGAAVTLLTATVLDAPTRPTLERFASQARALWQATRDATAQTLFEPASALIATRAEVADPEPTEATPKATRETTEETAPTPATPGAPPAADVVALAPLAPLAGEWPETREPAYLDTLLEQTDVAAATDANPGDGTAPRAQASVWAPFHSEVSARGFAQRLSAEIGYPFAVERTGPGAYQVTFDYDTLDERVDLESAIAEVTGR